MDDALSTFAPLRYHRRVIRRLGVASVLLAVALIYGPGLGAPFVFDDLASVTDNPQIRQLSTAFDPPPDSPLSGRPLVHATFALGYALAGLEPAAHRAPNLLFHLLNALLLWTLLRRILCRSELPGWVRERAGGVAGAVAALWTLHPLQTEAVAYVTQRTELLSSTALLAVLSFSLRAFERPDDRRPALLASLACALGSACKETLVVAPALVLCLDRAFFSPSLSAALARHRLLYFGQLVGLAPLAALALGAPRGETAGFGLGIAVLDNLALQGRAIAHYLRLAAWPDLLTVTYNWPVDQALDRYWPADVAIALLFGLTVTLSFRRHRAALLGWFFFIPLAPSSSIVPILSEMVAERRMYLALAAGLTAIGLLAAKALAEATRPRWPLAAVGCCLLAAAYAARSRERVGDYRSGEALFTSALATAPDNPQAMWGLAHAYEARGAHDRAIALYERMAERPYPYVGPASWGTRGLVARADLHSRLGQRDLAIATMQRALAHDPSSAIGRLQHAAAAAIGGEPERARAELRALLSQPYLHDRIHLELGLLELRLGDQAQAKRHFAEALRLAPDGARIEERISMATRAAPP